MSRLCDTLIDQEDKAMAREGLDAFLLENPLPLPPEPVLTGADVSVGIYRGCELPEIPTVVSVLADHRKWLQIAPRSTTMVRAILFPGFGRVGIVRDTILVRIAQALSAVGYTPNDTGPNPTWSWTEPEAQEELDQFIDCESSFSSPRLNLNNSWIRESPRTSEEIEDYLGTECILGGVSSGDERNQLNALLREAGYVPSSEETDNPTWTMPLPF
jgi:hypothetical protein